LKTLHCWKHNIQNLSVPSGIAPIIVAVNCRDSFISVFAFNPKMHQC